MFVVEALVEGELGVGVAVHGPVVVVDEPVVVVTQAGEVGHRGVTAVGGVNDVVDLVDALPTVREPAVHVAGDDSFTDMGLRIWAGTARTFGKVAMICPVVLMINGEMTPSHARRCADAAVRAAWGHTPRTRHTKPVSSPGLQRLTPTQLRPERNHHLTHTSTGQISGIDSRQSIHRSDQRFHTILDIHAIGDTGTRTSPVIEHVYEYTSSHRQAQPPTPTKHAAAQQLYPQTIGHYRRVASVRSGLRVLPWECGLSRSV